MTVSKKTWLILAIVIIAVGVVVGITLSRDSSSPSDLTLPIIAWNETTLSTFEGTAAVLNFWSISCPYCLQQLPYFEAVAQENEAELKVVAINIRDSASRIQQFFGEYEPTMTIALDNSAEAFVDYCLAYNNTRRAIPFTLFVDLEGAVQYVKIGAFASEEALRSTLHDVFGIATP